MLTDDEIKTLRGNSVCKTVKGRETLKEILLPIPDMEIQYQIKDKIIESLNLRKQSKHLLECAKRAVEIAIEQDEQTAIGYLEREAQEFNC